MVMHADDTAVVFTADCVSELEHIANSELDKINAQFTANKLTINTKKTKYTIFRSQKKESAMMMSHLSLATLRLNTQAHLNTSVLFQTTIYTGATISTICCSHLDVMNYYRPVSISTVTFCVSCTFPTHVIYCTGRTIAISTQSDDFKNVHFELLLIVNITKQPSHCFVPCKSSHLITFDF